MSGTVCVVCIYPCISPGPYCTDVSDGVHCNEGDDGTTAGLGNVVVKYVMMEERVCVLSIADVGVDVNEYVIVHSTTIEGADMGVVGMKVATCCCVPLGNTRYISNSVACTCVGDVNTYSIESEGDVDVGKVGVILCT